VAARRKELGEAGAAEGGPMAEVQEVGVGLVGVPGGRIDPPREISRRRQMGRNAIGLVRGEVDRRTLAEEMEAGSPEP
jgi:hypothetical protein